MIRFDKCIFEILAKLSVAQLRAVCDFINTKIDILERDLNKTLAVTDQTSTLFGQVDSIINSAHLLIDEKVAQSPILSIARSLGPNCGPLADIFQGAIDSGQLSATVLADALYVAKQIKTRAAILVTARNEALDAIDALRDVCGIIQLVILQSAGDGPGAVRSSFSDLFRAQGAGSSQEAVGPLAAGSSQATVTPAGDLVAPDGSLSTVPLS